MLHRYFRLSPALVFLMAACASPTVDLRSVGTQAPAPLPAEPQLLARQKHPNSLPVAVLPLDDAGLFRRERADLRQELVNHLGRVARGDEIMSLAEVDAKLRPVSKTTGQRCAFEGVPTQRKAEDAALRPTEVVHVLGTGDDGKGEELWVKIAGRGESADVTFKAPWKKGLGRAEQYRAAFAALTESEGGGLVLGFGGIGTTGALEAARTGALTICEQRSFAKCDPLSREWSDRAPQIAACFAGDDDETRDVLLLSEGGTRYCELANLDATDGPEGAREACLCAAIEGSTAFDKRAGRRTVRVHFESPYVVGRPRPELRVIESTTNLRAANEWHALRSAVDGKEFDRPVWRLAVQNLQSLAGPLARCTLPAGSLVVADIEVGEDGTLGASALRSGLLGRETAACIRDALTRGAFACTNNGQPARVRVTMEWPR